jgi:D-lactate dehydrogenase
VARSRHFNFRQNELIGFNFYGKTVGIIGLSNTGQAVANIFTGLGCKVIGYDISPPKNVSNITMVTLNELWQQSHVISLHAPLTPATRHMVNNDVLAKMRTGVMLLNTSHGALINTDDVLQALNSGKIGYLGIDVYEHEKGLFFENHENDAVKDQLLQKLMNHPNVLITPHQAYLTHEALQQIADQTIKNIDLWQQDKCVGKACICVKNCRATETTAIPLNVFIK